MNGRYTKRIRREINRSNRCNADLFFQEMEGLPLSQRIRFCLDILLRVNLKAKENKGMGGIKILKNLARNIGRSGRKVVLAIGNLNQNR